MARKFTPYEYAHLVKHGFNGTELKELIDDDIPVEYITNRVDFRGREFLVNQNVLIPRVETEQIIDIGICEIKERIASQQLVTFYDIGTGSGIIGISFAIELLKKNIAFHGYLSDLSKQAVKVAIRNAKNLLSSNIRVVQSDDELKITTDFDKFNYIKIFESNLFGQYLAPKADIIFANLPYVPSKRIDTLDNSVKNFEPLVALDGGEDGLETIRKLINSSKKYLRKSGVIILEVDDTHNNVSEFKKEWNIRVVKDFQDKNRFWILKQINT